MQDEHSMSASLRIARTRATCTIAAQARKHPQLPQLQPLGCRAPRRATMATPAHEFEEKQAVVKKKRASAAQAPPAKTKRIGNAAELVYRSPGPLPPLTGVLNMLRCQARRLVPCPLSRIDTCKFGFWIADLRDVRSRLLLVQTSWRKGEIHCRVEAQKRGTPHLHFFCYAPRGVLEPPSDGSYHAARKRPRDAEPPDV